MARSHPNPDVLQEMLRRTGNKILRTDKARLDATWGFASPGDFVVCGAKEQVNKLADMRHLDVLELDDGMSVVRKPLGSKYVVFTLAVGENMRSSLLTRVMLATARMYADGLGADFRVIRRPIDGLNLMFAKWRVEELLSEYERALYFDADVFILPGCPDAFGMVPVECLGGYTEAWFRREDVNAEWGAFVSEFGNVVPEEVFADGYVNAGMFVVSRMHAGMFVIGDMALMNRVDVKLVGAGSGLHDQPMMNWRRAEREIPLFKMPAEMNFLAWPFSAANRFRAGMVHYASEAKRFMTHDIGVVMDMYVHGRGCGLEFGVNHEDLKWRCR
jgi:hypothetical protein